MKSSAAAIALPTVDVFFAEMSRLFKLKERQSQRDLAEFTRSVLAEGGVGCAEAPTGTGKTLAYLAGALDEQAHAGEPLPIVVATATVALQEQIMRDDIPRLEAAGLIPRNSTVIAKGRGRYFCPRNAAVLEDKKFQQNQMELLATDAPPPVDGVPIALDMLKKWRDKSWSGDQDDWEGPLPRCWGDYCAATAETCVGRSCDMREQCPYYSSRERMAKCQLIIANQDMVLADLAQRSEDSDKSALPFKQYKLIVDEAHNFPEKAVKTRKVLANLWDSAWLSDMDAWTERVLLVPEVVRALKKEGYTRQHLANLILASRKGLVGAHDACATMPGFDKSGLLSWGMKTPAIAVLRAGEEAARHFLPLADILGLLAKTLSVAAEETIGADKTALLRLLGTTTQFKKKAEQFQQGLAAFCFEDGLVRWLHRHADGRVTMHAQPLEGAQVLTSLLWNLNIPTVMVSATLQLGGSFSRFTAKAGLPAHTRFLTLDPVFDYSRGTLHLPDLTLEPGSSGFDAEIAYQLDTLFAAKTAPGMLVLFTSREAMRRTMAACSPDVQAHALIVDGVPVPEMVARHKARIDAGHRSILVGLDSLAEGLDLPGKYCGHLVITRLPFGVPTDPVEQARQIALGTRWFDEAYLADMFTALIQYTGRLIRREDDHGVISILDVRLKRRKYAMKAYGAMPGFHRTPTLEGYFEYAKARGFDLSHGAASAPSQKPTLTLVQPGAPMPDASAPRTPSQPAAAPAGAAQPPGNVAHIAEGLIRQATRTATSAPLSAEIKLPPNQDILEYLGYAYQQPKDSRTEDISVSFSDDSLPYFDPGTPAGAWVAAELPEAQILGLYFQATSSELPSKSKFARALQRRPDALQHASILLAHAGVRPDARSVYISYETTRTALEVIAGDLPPLNEIRREFAEILARVTAYCQTPHRGTTRELSQLLLAASLSEPA